MKKISLIMVMFLLFTSVNAVELGNSATGLKNNNPGIYEIIKSQAIAKWDDNHSMIVYEINKQSDALFACDKLFDVHKDIAMKAVTKWYDGDISEIDGTRSIYEYPINWSMVEYEIKKQTAAESSY